VQLINGVWGVKGAFPWQYRHLSCTPTHSLARLFLSQPTTNQAPTTPQCLDLFTKRAWVFYLLQCHHDRVINLVGNQAVATTVPALRAGCTPLHPIEKEAPTLVISLLKQHVLLHHELVASSEVQHHRIFRRRNEMSSLPWQPSCHGSELAKRSAKPTLSCTMPRALYV
jgi:hypothetical protein